MKPHLLIAVWGLLSLAALQAAVPASFAYLLQAESLAGGKPAAISGLAESGRDWVVLDTLFESGEPWTPADLDLIRAGQPGRKVLAYISIGEAEDYRAYWDKNWSSPSKKPKWLREENPDWKGNFRAAYWHPDWQAVILKVVDEAMVAGFDGVYLDIVDGFEAFEKMGTRFVDDRVNPETNQSFRRDMVEWVKKVAGRARTKRADALVIPQNGSQLLAHQDFLEAISGVGIEDLFTQGNRHQPASHTEYVLGFLKMLKNTGKPVLVIEYPERDKTISYARTSNHSQGFTWLITDRDLKSLGTSGH